MRHRLVRGSLGVAIVVVAAGCTTIDGKPTAAESVTRSSTSVDAPSVTTTAPSAPAGPPIGMATMEVRGGTGSATVTYQINGAAEQSEIDVPLPWSKQYPVYDEVQSSVTADGGDAELICTIIMDGKLLAFRSEPRPSCSFAYYG